MSPASPILRILTSPYLLMVLPILFWAGNAVVGRAAVGDIPPFALSFWRWVGALAILLPFGLPRLWAQRARLAGRWGLLTALAVTSVSLYNTLLYLAVQTTTAINVTLVASSLPVAIILLSRVWLGEPIRGLQGLGVLTSLVGVVMVIGRGDPATLMALEPSRGDLIMLVAVITWAVYSVLLRRHPIGMDHVALLTVLMALGTPFILPFYLWELAQGRGFSPDPGNLAVIGYVALFPSVLAYYFWNRGVAALGPNLAGQYTYLMPVFTAVLAVLFLGESFRWYHLAGLALIFAGIWIATSAARRR